MRIESLRPYRSFVLAFLPLGYDDDGFIPRAAAEARRLVERLDGVPPREVVAAVEDSPVADFQVGVLHYRRDSRASWTTDTAVRVVEPHLVILARLGRVVGLHTTEEAVRDALCRRLGRRGARTGLGILTPATPNQLHAAFAVGVPRGAWLKGTHRRDGLKPDTKSVSAHDLRKTLNPVDDQSYTLSSSRWRSDLRGVPSFTVHITGRRSSIAAGPSADWPQWAKATRELFKRLRDAEEELFEPLPILAAAAYDALPARDAIELSLLPPAPLSEDPPEPGTMRALKAEVSECVSFEVVVPEGAAVLGLVHWTDPDTGKCELFGDFEFRPDFTDPQRVEIAMAVTPSFPQPATISKAGWISTFSKPPDGLLNVRYSSGHVLCDGKLVYLRHRDLPFTDFVWADLGATNLHLEKPPARAGAVLGTGNSLFCWCVRNWPVGGPDGRSPGGWLACDDGQGEIADFVHFEDRLAQPVLTLAHVKAAKRMSSLREVSVTAFEEVAAQAQKNVRQLDRANLVDGLRLGRRVAGRVWHDRKPASLESMIERIEHQWAAARLRVVIFQPHLSRSAHDRARMAPGSAEAFRLRQLDTLLWEVASACKDMGAEFAVLADGS